MKTPTIRGKVIGAGRPKTIVPIVAQTHTQIINAAIALQNVPLDFVEWRADFFDQVTDCIALTALLHDLRAALSNIPLLVTYRRHVEGGNGAATPDEYAAFCQCALQSGDVDLLDIELSIGAPHFAQLVSTAHAATVPVVASSHDFAKTPPTDEMVATLCKMQDGGADIAKLAVMPLGKMDLLNLFAASAIMTEQHPDTPIITMSMGSIGQASRVCGGSFGSAMTFASLGTASAPGQIALDQMNIMLDALYGNA
ncbi:MAG: type I 3-dehydroquinate dehydratase [Faecalibacterium sp.]